MSSARAVEIVLPCRLFTVQARLGEPDGLSPVEQVLVRAIGAGLDAIERIEGMLGLPRPMVVDAVYDLWVKGHVVADFRRGRVRLSSSAAAALEAGRLSSLESAELNLESITLVQELLTGRPLPVMGGKRPGYKDAHIVPVQASRFDSTRFTRQDLLDAVARALNRRARAEGRPLGVKEAWVDVNPTESEGEEPRFLTLTVDCRRSGHGERLAFTIIDTDRFDPATSRSIEDGLSRLAERLPDHLFFKRFMELTSPEEPVLDLENALEKLERGVEKSRDIDPGLLEGRHADLRLLFRQTLQALWRYRGDPVGCSVIHGQVDHRSAIRRMFAEATSQIVLACPFVSPRAMDERMNVGGQLSASYWTMIEEALARGVRVFLLWGINADETLSLEMENRRSLLQKAHPGRFMMSRTSARTHAKVVVRDAAEALVSSFNFLDPSREGTTEIGILVGGPQGALPAVPVEEVLAWAKEAFPDYDMSQALLTYAEAFQPDVERPSHEDKSAIVPKPVPATMREDSVLWAAAAYAWHQGWQAALAHLESTAFDPKPTGRLVEDGEHRAFLEEALTGARSRIVITSDHLGADVLTGWFLSALESALQRGVRVVLIWRRSDERVLDSSATPEKKLGAVAARYPGRLALMPRRGESPAGSGNHAKVLVFDDSAIISSFNFLSMTGDYSPGPLAAQRRRRSEIGFLVRGRDASKMVEEVLAAEYGPEAVPPMAPTARPSSVEGSPRRPLSLDILTRLLDGDARSLEIWARESASPWNDLAAMEAAGVPGERLEQAAGSLVAFGRPDDGGNEAIRWRRWLAGRRWRAGDFVLASLLLAGLGGEDAPTERMRRIACLASCPERFLSALDEAACDDTTLREEADLAIATSLPVFLVDGVVEAVEAIGLLSPRASEPLKNWASSALSWWEEHHRGQLDMVVVRSTIDRQGLEAVSENLRLAFVAALDHAENIGFRFPLGEHTWDELRKSDGMLGVMRAFATSNDAVGLRGWFEGCEERGESFEQLMDQATARVTRITGDLIKRPKRDICLSRLEQAWSAAKAWVQSVPGDDESSRWAISAGAQLGRLWAPDRDAVARLEAEGGFSAPAIRSLLSLADDLIKLRSRS